MEKRTNSGISFKLGLLFVVLLNVFGCKKVDTVVEVPPQAHFTGVTFDSYFITGPSVTKKIPIGLANVSDKDRTVTFSVTSPTGAVAGTHYNIMGGNSIVIPAGEALDSITVAGVYSQYLSGRKDTLIVTITDNEEISASTYNSQLKLFMRGPCSELEIVFTELLGAYTKTYENMSYGPYTTSIINFTPINATSGMATITNIYDSGIDGVATFDWTTPGNYKVTFAPQPVAAFPGFFVKSAGGQSGTFSYCTSSFSIPLELYTAAGTYDSWIMTMAR